MTTPTTRETADHAELARLAEARMGYRPAPDTATTRAEEAALASSDDRRFRKLDGDFRAAFTPAVCSDLLSEIAALRDYGRDVAKEAVEYRRQRDELRKALERIADEAPYRSGYCQSDVEYGPALSADEMQAVARQALANQGADQ